MAYNLEELRKEAKTSIRETIKEYGMEDIGASIHELADGLTPVYWSDCFQLADDYPEIGQYNVGNEATPAKICQTAVFLWIEDVLHEELQKIEKEQKEEIDDDESK